MTHKESYTFPLTILNGTALSNAVDFREYAFAVLHMPAAWTAADIGFQVSSAPDGTYLPLYDHLGVLVEIISPAANQVHAIPVDVLASRFFRVWSQSAAADVNQLAERALIIDMK